jgi:hypothetical protein
MNMKSTLTAAAIALSTLSFANADVQTYQGSTRWAATLFTPGARTVKSSSSYTSYYIFETSGGGVINSIRIDAWTSKTGRYYYIDNSLFADYDYFGFYGTDIAGGMESDDISTVMPFHGVTRHGTLNSFVLFPSVDYYSSNGNLDISTITGSARLNTYFSGNISFNTAINSVLNYLESRGYYEN